MADINVERRGPNIWPWIIGLIILGLLIWAIAEIIDRGAPPPQVATEVVPRPPAAGPPTAIAAPDLSSLLPLGPEDENAPATVRGQVVGQPIPAGFWVHTKENVVIFVKSTRSVKGNEPVAAIGTLRSAPAGQGGAWATQAKLQTPTAWTVNEQFYLDANAPPAAPPPGGAGAPAAPGTPPGAAPGTAPGTPPDSAAPGAQPGAQPGTPPGTQPAAPPGT